MVSIDNEDYSFLFFLKRLEKMQKWVHDDLSRATIKAQANFLVAMGIFNYIEILGGFYFYNDNIKKYKGFNFVLKNLFPKEYSAVVDQLNAITDNGSYDLLRCGMTHEYLVKTYKLKGKDKFFRFTVYGVESQKQYDFTIKNWKCGLELLIEKKSCYLKIHNSRLIYDLNGAFDDYKNRLLEPENYDYRYRFVQRCKRINFKDFD